MSGRRAWTCTRHHSLLRTAGIVGAVTASGIAAACASRAIELPGSTPAMSAPAAQRADPVSSVRAGFGRADITPPPVGALMGNGPEGRPARGYRHRLYARAMLLEDARGERLAFVVADLGFISLALQRQVAGAAAARSHIGPDRLILSATHTHSGPGHYFALRGFDDFGSSLKGFDPGMLEFLTLQIASAINAAADSLRPARAIWAIDSVWGQTRNRAQQSFQRNVPRFVSRWPAPSALPDAYTMLDPSFTMLRVDQWDSGAGAFRPAGAFSIFAMHGTGNTSWNALYDGDIHAIVERALEHHIDSLNGRSRRAIPRALHLFANSAEGDVSPAWRQESRCMPPEPGRGVRVNGPRAPRAPDVWVTPSENPAGCMQAAREDVARIGTAVGARAIQIFDRLGVLLADPARERASRNVAIARAFEVTTMIGGHELPGLCRSARTGTPTPVGVSDAVSRFEGWELFGVIPLGFDSAGARSVDPDECHSPKRPFLGSLQQLLFGNTPLPEVAQLTVVRVGGMVLGATPGELTTTAGARARDSIAHGARRTGAHRDSVALIGLANGYIYYVTTPEEYDVQHYEGSSTLYGRETASYIASRLTTLAAALPDRGEPSAPSFAAPLQAVPGPETRRFPGRDVGSPPSALSRTLALRWSASRDTLIAEWNDLQMGRLLPSDGLRLAILERRAAGWDTVAWDDDRNVEMWVVNRRGDRWRARWASRAWGKGHKVVLLPLHGMRLVSSDSVP